MANLSLDRLLFDPSDTADSANVGAYVRAGTDGDLISSTNVGGKEGLDVNVINAAASSYAEDSAHVSGDTGNFVLAVRADAQGSLVSADGDYAPLQVDSAGRLRTITDIDLVGDITADGAADNEDPLKVGSHAYDAASPLGAVDADDKANLASDLYRRIFINDAPNVGMAATAVTVADTETALPTTPLAGRMRIIVQNKGSNSIFVGPTGVLSTTGLEINKAATLALELGEGVALFGITASGTVATRVLEIA